MGADKSNLRRTFAVRVVGVASVRHRLYVSYMWDSRCSFFFIFGEVRGIAGNGERKPWVHLWRGWRNTRRRTRYGVRRRCCASSPMATRHSHKGKKATSKGLIAYQTTPRNKKFTASRSKGRRQTTAQRMPKEERHDLQRSSFSSCHLDLSC